MICLFSLQIMGLSYIIRIGETMAKRKRQKASEPGKVKFSAEITGLIFILISVIGIGSFGPVGHVIKSFTIFVMGTWWAILVLLFLILGIYMILKRSVPKFFHVRLIGLYILVISLLSFSHIDYVGANPELSLGSIMKNTIDNFMIIINSDNFLNLSQMGGGIIGAFFSWAFVNLVDLTGTYIVLGILSFFGIFMLLNVTIGDVIDKIKVLFKREPKDPNAPSFKLPEEEEDYEIITANRNDDKKKSIEEEGYAPMVQNSSLNGEYKLPPIDILDPVQKIGKLNSEEFLLENKQQLERVLNDFQIVGKVVDFHEGPAVTQYEVEIKAGTKISRITSISKEIALALAAKDVRIQAPIPGKNTVGVEIPNKHKATVPIREVLTTIPKSMQDAKILVALGKDINGRSVCADIEKMPHLLVAGATGSGKSVCINSFIASILMFKTPDEIKLVLVDPKKVELSNYNGIPHLLCPVVTDPKKAAVALQRIVAEMDRRYGLMEEKGTKNITVYNATIEKEYRKSDEVPPTLPRIVVIIDELADLMLVAPKEVEDSILRITQMARAAGIHLIVATQRPSTDIITGIVKANIPSRIAFTVASFIDSRTILDAPGAEKLLGRGDMLYSPTGELVPQRIQGTFISDDEIARLIKHVSEQQVAQYDNSLATLEATQMSISASDVEEYDDPLYNEIVDFAITSGKISASLIQRRFRLGYNRAARIIDLLEERGIVGPQNGSKPREILQKSSHIPSDE